MNTMLQEQLSVLFNTIRSTPEHHSCLSLHYHELKANAKKILSSLYGENGPQTAYIPDIGDIALPFFSMGYVNSVNLFDLDELIIFSLYYHYKAKYKSVLDIGANIGLHSIVMAKLGFNVTAFEPDPIHYDKLLSNSSINNIDSSLIAIKAAVSKTSGFAEFTRVLGNTTGSHLSSAKVGAYGDLEKFNVDVVRINDFLSNTDLIKLDAEGEELNIIQGIDAESWSNLDIIAELGNEYNARTTLDYLEGIDVKIYSQKNNWKRVNSYSLMPTSYKEGSVFISRSNATPWTCS